MRRGLLGTLCVFVLGVGAYLGARPQGDTATVRLRLIDADTGKPVAGIVRVTADGSDRPLTLPGLFDRVRGLGKLGKPVGWQVVPSGGAETTLPRGKLRLEALSGLETALTRQALDLTGRAPAEVTVKLRPLFRPEEHGLAAGNTHLHLRDLTPKQADEYLSTIPAADGLKVLFISYLERHKDDASYITNRYPVGELKQFDATGVLLGNGEEHRHNFQAFGEGYGHVMFLGIRKRVQPVSIGPGLTGGGHDDPALRPGIDDARGQGGTVIWCHNASGFEAVLSALAGRLDALNVFDGARTGKFEDTYYRYLNIGLRLPLSTGTDWFLYDFARVYAKPEGKLTLTSWLEAVKAGRCQATNGPLLRLKVGGREVGDTLELAKPTTVRIEASAVGRHDFERLQLVQNGKVVKAVAAEKKGGGYAAGLLHEVRLDQGAWFAVRIESRAKNEMDRLLYAHSSAVYVRFAGRGAFDVEAARDLLRRLEEGKATVRARASFSSPEAGRRVLALYDEATRDLTERIERRKR